MTRSPVILFIALMLLIGAAGVAPAAHAQTICTTAGTACTATDGSTGTCASDPDTNTFYCLSSSLGNATANNPGGSVDKAAEGTPKTLPADPDMSKGFGTVMTWIMSLFAWLVGVAALTLDYAVYYTVVTMGDYVNKLSAVGVTWRIMRDFGNIALIFGFLAAGIMTILNVDWYGFGKKMLPMLIVSAVFLNFSLFAAEAVIDAGNLFATQFYTQIKGGTVPSQASLSQTTIENEGVSNKIMAQLGLQTIYTAGRVNADVYKAGNTWLISFMGIILFTITAFVMFSLAFILIARFVILLILIIIAPLGFAGLAIPKLKNVADKWWAELFEQTITAPVLLLLLYVALAVITDAQFLTGLCGGGTCSKNWIGFVNGNDLTGFASMILSFLVAMGLLLAVVVASKKLSAFGGNWATATAGKLSFGATAWAGRNTVGWGTHRAAKYLRGTAFSRIPLVGTGITRGLEGIASSNFDVRGVKFGGGLKGVGVDAGDAQKGGYRADLKSRIESRTKYASELKGRELDDNEKRRQVRLQKEVADSEKELQKKQLEQDANRARGRIDSALDKEIEILEKVLGGATRDLADLESVTDKGAQRKYATVLELGLNPKGKFNTYFNFAANTEAAKKIREEAKKSSDDKTLDQLKKALKKVGGEEEGVAPATPAGGGAAGGGGGAPSGVGDGGGAGP